MDPRALTGQGLRGLQEVGDALLLRKEGSAGENIF